jgi:hypothetical protein
VPAAGGEARLLVSHPAYDRGLALAGRSKLAFIDAHGNGDIYVLTLATGHLDRVTFDDVSEQLDAWSRDGSDTAARPAARTNGMNDIFRVKPPAHDGR